MGKDGTVFVRYNFTISDGRVCALNPATGGTKWIYNTVRSINQGGGQVTSHFAIGENGILYYGTAGGFLQVLKFARVWMRADSRAQAATPGGNDGAG